MLDGNFNKNGESKRQLNDEDEDSDDDDMDQKLKFVITKPPPTHQSSTTLVNNLRNYKNRLRFFGLESKGKKLNSFLKLPLPAHTKPTISNSDMVKINTNKSAQLCCENLDKIDKV